MRLKILSCQNLNISSIPNLENLQKLDCTDCIFLKTIPHIVGLKKLYCNNCNIISIPHIVGLKILECKNCNLLTSLPAIKDLRTLDDSNCPWINPEEEKINKLIILQKWFDRYLKRKKLDETINIYSTMNTQLKKLLTFSHFI